MPPEMFDRVSGKVRLMSAEELVQCFINGEDAAVIDLLLLTQFAWCTVWLMAKRINDTMLYVGGIIAAGYVAWMASGWVTQWFLPQSGNTFLWLEGHITTSAQAVSVLSWMVPPEPVSSLTMNSKWIALHIAHIFVFAAVTLAVFAVFSMIVYLRRALWDLPAPVKTRGTILANGVASVFASIYLVFVLVLIMGDLAWIRDCGWLVNPLRDSWIVREVGILTHSIHENVLGG